MTRISLISSGKQPGEAGERRGTEEEARAGRASSPVSHTCLTVLVVVSAAVMIATSIGTAFTIAQLNYHQCSNQGGATVPPPGPAPTTVEPSVEPPGTNESRKASPVRYNSDTHVADEKQPFSFDDMYNSSLVPRSPQGKWAGDEEVTYLNDNQELVLHNINTDIKTIIMTNDTFIEYKPNSYNLSPDRSYVLITYDLITELQDPDTFAKHKIYVRETGELLSFPNDDAMRDKMVMYTVWTPSGSGLMFVFDDDMYYQLDPTSSPERLTTSGANHKTRNGLAFWNYRGVLQASAAIWWSPDMSLLAYGEFNSTAITLSEHPIYKQQVYPAMFRQVYLKAGDAAHFSLSKLHILDMTDPTRPRKTVVAPTEFRNKDHYFYNVLWKDSETFAVAWTDRIQKRSIVEFCDYTTLECVRNHDITINNGWFAGLQLIMFIEDGSHYLAVLPKETGSSGRYRQVAMVSSQDGTVTWLTDDIKEVYWVDGYDSQRHLVWQYAMHLALAQRIAFRQLRREYGHAYQNHGDIECLYSYYTGTNGLQLGQHVFSVGTPDADASVRDVQCLTCSEGADCGYVSASFSPSTNNYLLQCLGPSVPYYHLRWTDDDTKSYTITDNAAVKANLDTRKLPSTEYHQIGIGDGYSGWAEFILPPDMVTDGSVKYPVMFYPYAGPHGTTQADYSYKAYSAPSGMWDYHLASSHNVIVVRLNGRGSGGRGDEFLFQLYRQLGTKEITDQIDGARSMIRDFPYVDENAFSVWGWSYGGFTTSHILGHESDVFKCGIAVAPVTNFRHYYAAYTERYMDLDTEEDNAVGYDGTDAIRKVENFRNKKYMIAHGTMDDNVHFQNAIELINALSKAQILFRTQLYVDQNHSIRNRSQNRHLFLSMNDFYFRECLGRSD